MYYSKAVLHPVLHTADCPCCKRIDPKNLGQLNSPEEIIHSRLRYCIHCNPLSKLLQSEADTLTVYCVSNGISLHKNKLGLRLSTPRSEWQIIYDGKRTQLYHRNTLHKEKNPTDLIPGFHAQKVSYPSLIQYCEYIINHDYYRMLNPMYAKAPKIPPAKGTKRYRKEQAKAKQRAKRDAALNVQRLIRALASESQPVPAIV